MCSEVPPLKITLSNSSLATLVDNMATTLATLTLPITTFTLVAVPGDEDTFSNLSGRGSSVIPSRILVLMLILDSA